MTLTLLVVTAFLALPASAQATLTYVKAPSNPSVYVAADNGSGAHKVGPGSDPRVSPDGRTVAYLRERSNKPPELWTAPAAGGSPKALMTNLRESFYLAFSPDSKTIAALRGPEVGKRKLVLVDLADGAQKTVASGFFSGFSFSPDGTEIVYSKAASERYPPRSDVYRVAADGGKATRLTKDHVSLDPLWGPGERIVFVKQLDASKRKYGPKNELFLMSPKGTGVKRLTHTKVDPLVQGLYPTEWSASGKQLLTEFEGQDTSYAVTVDPKTGAQRALDKADQGERGFVGTALSRDGTTVLGYTGGFEPGPGHDVATMPYGGGKAKVLVKDAYSPAWSR